MMYKTASNYFKCVVCKKKVIKQLSNAFDKRCKKHKLKMKVYRSSKPYTYQGTDAMKEDRLQYADDIVQPGTSDQPSQEFIDRYPEESKKMFTPKQMTKADYIWRDQKPHYRKHGKVASFYFG